MQFSAANLGKQIVSNNKLKSIRIQSLSAHFVNVIFLKYHRNILHLLCSTYSKTKVFLKYYHVEQLMKRLEKVLESVVKMQKGS